MENSKVEEVTEILFKENQGFRELVQKHQNYEDRLNQLAELSYPNDDEVLEENTLKRKKLAIKDEMYSIMNEYSNLH